MAAGVFMTEPVKVGVIGVGYLGRFHAEKFAALAETELVAEAAMAAVPSFVITGRIASNFLSPQPLLNRNKARLLNIIKDFKISDLIF